LILPLIQPPAHDHRPVTIRAPCGQVPAMACGVSRRCPLTMRLAPWSPPGRRQSRSATAIPTPPVARGGSAGRECEEPVLTGESLPAEKLPESFRLARRWAS
jgi:hypothetical protein